MQRNYKLFLFCETLFQAITFVSPLLFVHKASFAKKNQCLNSVLLEPFNLLVV